MLWDRSGPAAAFGMFGAVYLVTIATVAVALREPRRRRIAAERAINVPPPTLTE